MVTLPRYLSSDPGIACLNQLTLVVRGRPLVDGAKEKKVRKPLLRALSTLQYTLYILK